MNKEIGYSELNARIYQLVSDARNLFFTPTRLSTETDYDTRVDKLAARSFRRYKRRLHALKVIEQLNRNYPRS